MENPGYAMGTNRAGDSERQPPSLGVSSGANPQPDDHGCDLFRVANGLPVEGTGCHGDLFRVGRPLLVSTMDPGRRIQENMETGIKGI